jgi:glucose/arabinose dehydrogenase
MTIRAWTCVALVWSCFTAAAAAGVLGSPYADAGRCGPFPRAALETPKGLCVGIVAGPEQGLKMPRTILEVKPGTFILTDMGGWVGPKGRVLRLTVTKDGKASVANVFADMYQPHGLALGPDGKIYVGEKSRISRFDPNAVTPALDVVASDLPKDGLHPLTNLVFAPDGALIVNIGAPTDRCETKAKPKVPQSPCPLTAGDRPRAALWRLSFDKPGGKVVKTEVLARGFRNSMALAYDPESGALLQGENGVDLPGEDEPAEELNVVKPRAHYGWPFCSGKGKPLPGAGLTKADCAQYEPAAVELPAHSAPLGMLIYAGALFPELKDKVIIALHGYRQYGHRIVALDAAQAIAGKGANLENIVSGWTRKKGLRPLGAPVGIVQAHDGAIWIVEDKNQTVLVLLRSDGATKTPPPLEPNAAATPPPPKGWDAFVREVVKVKCTTCHAEARKPDAVQIWEAMAASGWVDEGALKDSKLARALSGDGPEKPMPPPSGLKADPKAKASFERLLSENP